MKTTPYWLIALLLISATLMSCSNDNENTPFIDEQATYSPMELEILRLVNEHRTGLNLSSLETLNIVSNEAEPHTNYMISTGKISHDNFSERHKNLVNKASAKAVAENVAKGFSSARSTMNAWLTSEGHRKNIENPSLTHFGISIKKDVTGKYFYTHIFIKK